MNEILPPEMADQDTGEIVEMATAALPALEAGEINMQIATARRFPRSLARVKSEILSLVTLDEESAEECVYALPRDGKAIMGPSIRFAEALQQAYGNCRSASRITEINRIDKYVEAEGVFFDLEKNTAQSVRVKRRISSRNGKIYSDDMILVAGNAAASIARRNAILAGVPKPLWRAAYAEANKVISGDITTLAANRDKAFKAFAAFGVKPEQLFAALGIGGVDDLTVDHIGTLRGMHSAIKNGESTVEEMFPSQVAEKQSDPNYNPLAGKPGTAKSDPKPASAATKQDPPADEAYDPELERAGAQAFVDGEERKAPDDLTPVQCKSWLKGWDTMKAGAQGKA